MNRPRFHRGDVCQDTRRNAPPMLYVGFHGDYLHFVTRYGCERHDYRTSEQHYQVLAHVDMTPFEQAVDAAKEMRQ